MAATAPRRLVIGIDFGTTYTGAAFVCTDTPTDVEVIKTWPGGPGSTTDKTPSEFVYPVPAPASGPHQHPKLAQNIRFGYEVLEDEERVKCIKLLMEHDQQLPSFVSVADVTSLLRQANRTVLEAIIDYLSKVKEHVLYILGNRYTPAFVSQTTLQFILTVPAIWSDKAKDMMMTAANRAGMGKGLRLISEPEAAAVYALRAIQPNHLNIGDNMVICDAGGGTVDLITYRIAQLEPLGVEETVVGTGGLCGSVFLDYGFENLLKNKLGQQVFSELVPRTLQGAKRRFATLKLQFTDNAQNEWLSMPGVPDMPHANVQGGYMVLTRDELRSVFDPVINPIIKLVEDQVAEVHARGQLVSALVLVGGLGQSTYLFERLKAHFATNHPPPYSRDPVPMGRGYVYANARPRLGDKTIQVLQPLNAWSAIVRGAVIRGLEGTIVTSRRCRYHYGVRMCQVFDPQKHTEDQRYWDALAEVYRARNCIEWFLPKGTTVSEERVISRGFFTDFEAEATDLIDRTTILMCKDDVAPARSGANVKQLCVLRVSLRRVPGRLWSDHVNSFGQDYRRLDHSIDMKIDSASMSFTLMAGGKSYGKVAAAFDHDEDQA